MLTIVLCVLVVVLVSDGLSYWLMWREMTRSQGVLLGLMAGSTKIQDAIDKRLVSLRASLESDIDTLAKEFEAQKADNDKLKTAIAELQGHAMQPAPVDDTPADPGSQWGRAKGRLQRAKKVVVEGETL